MAWGKALTRADDGQWGRQPNPAMEECGLTWVRTFGGETFSADGKRVTLDSAEAMAGLEYMADAPFQAPDHGQPARQRTGALPAGKGGPPAGHAGLVVEYTAPNQAFVAFEWAIRAPPAPGQRGKWGTMFGGSALTISRQTKHVAESWEWVKFMANKENGVLQVAGGGSPGCREDVWSDPRLAQLSPVYGLIQRTYKTPGPVHLPWNESYFELIALINARLNPVWDGAAAARGGAGHHPRGGADPEKPGWRVEAQASPGGGRGLERRRSGRGEQGRLTRCGGAHASHPHSAWRRPYHQLAGEDHLLRPAPALPRDAPEEQFSRTAALPAPGGGRGSGALPGRAPGGTRPCPTTATSSGTAGRLRAGRGRGRPGATWLLYRYGAQERALVDQLGVAQARRRRQRCRAPRAPQGRHGRRCRAPRGRAGTRPGVLGRGAPRTAPT